MRAHLLMAPALSSDLFVFKTDVGVIKKGECSDDSDCKGSLACSESSVGGGMLVRTNDSV